MKALQGRVTPEFLLPYLHLVGVGDEWDRLGNERAIVFNLGQFGKVLLLEVFGQQVALPIRVSASPCVKWAI
jgi:hypothetical protein